MAIKLFVGGLSFGTSEATLKKACEAVTDVVSVSVVLERETGRSRGFAFIEVADAAAATKLIGALNGKPLDGRTITINEARPNENSLPRRV